MFREYSSNKINMALFSWYLDYHLWEIMLKMGTKAILENKNINTKLKYIDPM